MTKNCFRSKSYADAAQSTSQSLKEFPELGESPSKTNNQVRTSRYMEVSQRKTKPRQQKIPEYWNDNSTTETEFHDAKSEYASGFDAASPCTTSDNKVSALTGDTAALSSLSTSPEETSNAAEKRSASATSSIEELKATENEQSSNASPLEEASKAPRGAGQPVKLLTNIRPPETSASDDPDERPPAGLEESVKTTPTKEVKTAYSGKL